VAGAGLELELGGFAVEAGVELEQRFVDRAELLGVEGLPVDGAAAAGLVDGGEGAEGREQVLVGQVGGVEVGGRAGAPEVGAEGRQGEEGFALVEALEDEAQGLPEVGVWGAGQRLGEAAEAAGAVVGLVAGAGEGLVGVVGVEGLAVLGDEQEDQAIDQAEELPVIVLEGELAACRACGGGRCCRARGGDVEEAGAEAFDRACDAVAEAVEGAGALGLGDRAPLLEPAITRAWRRRREIDGR
jgi:hypothetical protein